MYTGSCLCGGIRFRIHAELAPIQICHCGQCRKAQGTPFGTNTPVRREDFELVSGHDLLKCHQASPGKCRWFCAECGSPIYSQRSAAPEVLRVRAGTIDEPTTGVQLAYHIYTGSRCAWWAIDDSLPRYDTLPPGA